MNNQEVADAIIDGTKMLETLPGVRKFSLIGSAMYLPDPADVDFAVLLNKGTDPIDYATSLDDQGWGRCGNYDANDSLWAAVRKDSLNFMLTADEGFYVRYLRAMDVCKALHLTDKMQRTAVCAIVRDGVKPEDTDWWKIGRHQRQANEDDSL